MSVSTMSDILPRTCAARLVWHQWWRSGERVRNVQWSCSPIEMLRVDRLAGSFAKALARYAEVLVSQLPKVSQSAGGESRRHACLPCMPGTIHSAVSKD